MKKNKSNSAAVLIVGTYATVAALWFTTVNSLFAAIISDARLRALVGWAKACLFVAITTSLLFYMVSKHLRERDSAQELKEQTLMRERSASLMLKEVARISTSPHMICDPNGAIISLNSAGAQASGIAENTPHISFDSLGTQLDAKCGWLLSSMKKATRLDQAETVLEKVALTSDQATMRIVRGPLLGHGQEPIGFFVSAIDVTELIQTQERLRESELQSKHLFHAHPHPMWVCDRHTHAILAVNDAAVAQYGYTREEFMRMTLSDISDDQGANAGPLRSGACRHKAKDGKAMDVDVLSNDMTHNGRDARLFLARDVSPVSSMAQELTDARNQLTDLTQRLLAHDQLTTQRLAQALHDEFGQRLYACAVLLEAGSMSDDSSQLRAIQLNALSQIRSAMTAVRSALIDLRPPYLEEDGLMPAMKYEVDRLHPHACNIQLVDRTEGKRWDAHIEYGVFMIAREALLNAIHHAQASTICTTVAWAGSALTLLVEDDGPGSSTELLLERPGHFGIAGMRERAASLGGHLHFSSAPEIGTKVFFELQSTTS